MTTEYSSKSLGLDLKRRDGAAKTEIDVELR